MGTRERVDEVLEYLTGSKLAIKDLFRLGRYKKRSGVAENAIPPRPVLIKFATPWDRRMVLMQKRKLKKCSHCSSVHSGGSFIRYASEEVSITLR